MTLAKCLADVRDFIRRFVVLSHHQATLLAVWIAMTHALDAFDYAAYVHITSPLPECGKSRLLEVLEALVANAWASARVSAAVLMRKVDKEHPVLLLDESDAAFNSDEQYSEALRGMLNAGFHRQGKASICVGQGASLTYRDFSVFGPKAIAGIGRLPSTVESRAIPIVMKRRSKGEEIHKWRRREAWASATDVRTHLMTALKPHRDALRQARPEMPPDLSDRVEDVLEPLLAIADLAGDQWPQDVRDAAVALMGQSSRAAREADQHLPLELLSDIRTIFEEYPDREDLATKVILESLVALEDRPWATFGKQEKPINSHRLARLLKGFNIQPAGTLRDGDRTYKGYRRVAFADAFARYLEPKASHGNNANETGFESHKTEASPVPGVTNPKTAQNPNKHEGCDDVTEAMPAKGKETCCESGPLQLRCKLCRRSPIHWQSREGPH